MIKHIATIAICFFLSSLINAQEKDLKFMLSKNLGEQKTIYFHIKGLDDENQADKLLKRLISEPLIYSGRIYKTPVLQDRCQLYLAHELDAAYILSVLQEFNLDFEYTTVSRNGHLETQMNTREVSKGSPRTPVLIDDFPEYDDTGNSDIDKQDYAERKRKWIEENPEKYQEALDDLN